MASFCSFRSETKSAKIRNRGRGVKVGLSFVSAFGFSLVFTLQLPKKEEEHSHRYSSIHRITVHHRSSGAVLHSSIMLSFFFVSKF